MTHPACTGRLAAPTSFSLPAFADASNAKVYEVGMLATPPLPFGAATRTRGAQPGADNNPASGRRPDTTVNRADIEYFKAVADAYKATTGIRATPPQRRPRGAFFQYGYYQYGVPSFTTPGWAPVAAASAPATPPAAPPATPTASPPASAATGDAAILKTLEAAGVNAFVAWTPFKHTELGDVEIGGVRPYTSNNALPKDLTELGRKQGEFLVKLASMLPRVRA